MMNDVDKGRELELLAIRNTMKTEIGRDFMWRMLQHSCVFETIFNIDPLLHSFNAGLRSMGLWIEQEIKEATPDNYIKMIKEHLDG